MARTFLFRGWAIVRSTARRWRAIIAGGEYSLADRIAATMAAVHAIALPNMVCAVSLAALYAWRLGRPLVMFGAVPLLLVVAASLTILPGARLAKGRYVRVVEARVAIALYAVAIGIAWSVLIGVIQALPIGVDRVAIACLTVAVICCGGMIFTLMPGAAVFFMSVVAIRLAIDLAALTGEPWFFTVAIAAFVTILSTLFLGQAEMFAERTRVADDLQALEKRRGEEEARAAEERHRLIQHEQQRRETERADAEAARRRAMAAHAAQFETTVLAVVDQLGAVVAELGVSTARLAQAGEATQQRTAAVQRRADAVAASMEAAMAATGRMRQSINQIGREVDGQVSATATAEAAARIAQEHAAALAARTQTVGEIVATIEMIAARTNTLALNALIEAARSGAAGQGFAVVAGEVKALATQTQQAASLISANIASMEACAADSAKSILAIGADVSRITHGASDIARAIVQQETATSDIGASVDQAASGARAVGADLHHVTAQAEIAAELAELLARLAQGLTTQSTDLSVAARDFSTQLRRG
ncbi:MAG: hypothetical protein B7Y45_12980 [Sphingomonas sp. 28-66-16]|nr:MAG: hypothetical protein B7Y45_12980 [Sphingomonas sp. 28-66-16]